MADRDSTGARAVTETLPVPSSIADLAGSIIACSRDKETDPGYNLYRIRKAAEAIIAFAAIADSEDLTESEHEGNRRAFRLGDIEDEITDLLDGLDYDRMTPTGEASIAAALEHARDALDAERSIYAVEAS